MAREDGKSLFLVAKSKPKIGSLVIPGESAEEFAALERGLLQEHQPAGATETQIVKDLAKCQWLKERAIRLEARITPGAKGWNTLEEYRRTNERAFANGLRVLRGLQKQRKTAEAMSPKPVDR